MLQTMRNKQYPVSNLGLPILFTLNYKICDNINIVLIAE